MKKILLVLLGFAITLNLFADPVNPKQASKIASNFFIQIAKSKGLKNVTLSLAFIEKSKSISQKGITNQEASIFYIFNVNQNDGFVIVSADDDVSPILGYALSGNYSNTNMPPAFVKLLEKYKKEIIDVSLNNLKADEEIQNKWNKLNNNEPFETTKDVNSVNPLVTTKWNQSPHVNDLCPYDNSYNERTVTGCPATAMAQIMKFWNYPTTGTSFHSYNHSTYGTLSANFASTTYNWGSMPNIVSSTNTAVATLMYQCGVAVEMNYGVASTGGSGSYVIIADNPTKCSEYAFKTYFGYNSATIQGLRRANYSDVNWKNLLKNELNSGRPIQYAGFGQGGHTFVCDGFDNNDFFHMNWGWGGYLDGFFNLDALNPGSGGTGSGAGTYNEGQQAIIGIQPPSGAVSSIINMNSSITITPNPIAFAQSFTVNADLINAGTNNFSGDFSAVLFTASGNFVDYIQILSASGTPLQPGYHYTNGLTFSSTGLLTVPGNYIIAIFYRDLNGNWILTGSTSYNNAVNVEISSPVNNIQQYSPIVANPTTFVQGQAASVNVNIANENTATFLGSFQAALYDLNGNFVQTIGTYNETNGLPSGYSYSSPYITFNSTAITATPGTYILGISELENGASAWQLIGGSYYSTPININVVAPPLSPDIYESNNTENNAYNFALSFSGNVASKNTIGSNLHIGGDLDYYNLNLASGYNYNITARVHDSYNSGNGQTYTSDVMFSYKYNSVWSDNFDDIMPSNITVLNGGNIVFNVAPFFAGGLGTYLLDLSITRTPVTSIIENEISNLNIYPNPAQSTLNIDLSDLSTKVKSIKIYDNIGKEVYNCNLSDYSSNLYKIPVTDFSNGLYFLCVITENKAITKRFTIQK